MRPEMGGQLCSPPIADETSVTSPPHPANDVSSSTSAVSPPRSSIERPTLHDAVDGHSSPRPAKRRTPPTDAQGEKPWKVPREGPEREQLVREIYSCNDISTNLYVATDVTDHIITSVLKMNPKKPGANSSLRPYNTIDDVIRPLNARRDRGVNNGFGIDSNLVQSKRDTAGWVIESSSTGPDSYSSKRRKIEQKSSPFGYEVESIEVVETVPPSPHRRRSPPQASTPSTPPPSRHNIGRNHSSTMDTIRSARSEYQETNLLTDPRRKKAHTATAQRSPLHTPRGAVENGTAKSSPIVLDPDPSAPEMVSSRRHQLRQFEQGNDGASDCESQDELAVVTSKHFPKATAKTNSPTTQPRRKFATEILRDSYELLQSTNDDVDELTVLKPDSKSKRRDQSLAKHLPPARGIKRTGKGTRQEGWPLVRCATHGYRGGPGLVLRQDASSTYFYVEESDGDTRNAASYLDIDLHKVNQAFTDHESYIRLRGSRPQGAMLYQVDFEFVQTEDLLRFIEAIARRITTRAIRHKPHEFMESVFDKAPEQTKSNPVHNSPIPQRDKSLEAMAESNRPKLLQNLKDSAGITKGITKSPAVVDSCKGSSPEQALRTFPRPIRSTRATMPIHVDPEEVHREKTPPKYSVVVGLGPAWQRQLSYSSGRYRAVVDWHDLPRLDDGEFLNDQLIDFYLIYLFNQMGVNSSEVYLFNTHFFSTLTRKAAGQKTSINYDAVARWTSKEDLFRYKYIVVPINQDIHWYLAIICNVQNIRQKSTVDDSKHSEVSEEKQADMHYPFRPKSPTSSAKAALTGTPDDNAVHLGEDRALNVVKLDAVKPEPNDQATTGNTVKDDLVFGNTAYLRTQHDSSEDKPQGILPHTPSPASSKKTKRKHGPPAKRWNLNEPTIIILDSLGGGARSQAVRALKDYIREEGKKKHDLEADITQNAFYAKTSQIPMQNNFSDCGVFLLGYAQKFFEDPDAFKNRLLKGEMDVNTDWPEMPMSQMRDTMRSILMDLYAKQEEERQRRKAERRNRHTISVKPSADRNALHPATGVTSPRVVIPPKAASPASPKRRYKGQGAKNDAFDDTTTARSSKRQKQEDDMTFTKSSPIHLNPPVKTGSARSKSIESPLASPRSTALAIPSVFESPARQHNKASIRGSSRDPIPIDDSQDDIIVSSLKPVKSVVQDSQEMIVVRSPEINREEETEEQGTELSDREQEQREDSWTIDSDSAVPESPVGEPMSLST